MTTPRLGSLWRLTPQSGGHVVLVATDNPVDELHALLAVDRPAGPEDVVVASSSIAWVGAPVPVRAIACRQQTVVARDWLSEELGMLGADECDAVGWLSAPPPAREGIPPPAPHLVGSAYTDLDDPRLTAVRADATIARGLLEDARSRRVEAPHSAGARVIGTLGERLLAAARELVVGVTDVIGVRLAPAPVLRGDPTGVRGDEPEARARPVDLEIPRAGRDLLGERVRSRAVIDAGGLHIWLSGITRLAPGHVVVLLALSPTGLLSEARAVIEEDTSVVSFRLEWLDANLPDEIAVAVIRG